MVKVTVGTLSDKGAAPTETERFIKELLKRVQGTSNEENINKLKIDIKPAVTTKLTNSVFAFIKNIESEYVNREANALTRWEFYTLTYIALTKLRFVFSNGKLSQPPYCKALGLRRATLTEKLQTADIMLKHHQKVYEEIERRLYQGEYRKF